MSQSGGQCSGEKRQSSWPKYLSSTGIADSCQTKIRLLTWQYVPVQKSILIFAHFERQNNRKTDNDT